MNRPWKLPKGKTVFSPSHRRPPKANPRLHATYKFTLASLTMPTPNENAQPRDYVFLLPRSIPLSLFVSFSVTLCLSVLFLIVSVSVSCPSFFHRFECLVLICLRFPRPWLSFWFVLFRLCAIQSCWFKEFLQSKFVCGIRFLLIRFYQDRYVVVLFYLSFVFIFSLFGKL